MKSIHNLTGSRTQVQPLATFTDKGAFPGKSLQTGTDNTEQDGSMGRHWTRMIRTSLAYKCIMHHLGGHRMLRPSNTCPMPGKTLQLKDGAQSTQRPSPHYSTHSNSRRTAHTCPRMQAGHSRLEWPCKADLFLWRGPFSIRFLVLRAFRIDPFKEGRTIAWPPPQVVAFQHLVKTLLCCCIFSSRLFCPPTFL